MEYLLPCPFCGNDLNRQDPLDTIYPAILLAGSNVYTIVCQEAAGGCEANILGETPEECVQKWNRRTRLDSVKSD